MKDNSDHHPFFARRIPVLMPFTGLHDDYHRPSDDSEKVNAAGMHRVAQLVFRIVYDLAQQPKLPAFRSASQAETAETQKRLERPLPPMAGRLGIHWNMQETDGGGVRVSRVLSGSAADIAGLRVGDRIVSFGGQPIRDGELFRSLVLISDSPATIGVMRAGKEEPVDLKVALTGHPIRLGLSWRVDDAEPGCLVVTRIVPGSPAERAGMQASDRILEIGGRTFTNGDEFQKLAAAMISPIELTRERMGQIRPVKLEIPAEQGVLSARVERPSRARPRGSVASPSGGSL